MRRTMIAVGLLLGLATLAGRADCPDPEPPGGGAELKKLKGSWTVTRAQIGKRDVKVASGMTYTFAGDKLTRTLNTGKVKKPRTFTFKIKLDTKKKPYKIEMIPEGAKTGTVGLFKIEKGELYLAMGRTKDGKPPTDFESATVMVLERVKENK